jgi:uncharacterized iron-regulated protein
MKFKWLNQAMPSTFPPTPDNLSAILAANRWYSSVLLTQLGGRKTRLYTNNGENKFRTGRIAKWALSLLLFLAYTSPVQAQKISSPRLQQNYTLQQVDRELAQANVVYLGESHDSAADHKAELEILQSLHQRHPKMAIAMEMFQRPYQGVLDRYLAGQLSEEELVAQSEYEQRWGFPWEYYAPILRFAKANQLPVLALNTPTEVTRKVALEGLESLTPAERRYIPPFSEIRTDNAEYRQLMLSAFKQHQAAGNGASAGFERFFLAQVLWDETMAERIAQFLQANPEYQVVVLAGQGHIVYGYGIPSRVARRLNNKHLVQRSVLLNPSEDTQFSTDKPIADFSWNTTPHD